MPACNGPEEHYGLGRRNTSQRRDELGAEPVEAEAAVPATVLAKLVGALSINQHRKQNSAH
jgi:hypothetical protein